MINVIIIALVGLILGLAGGYIYKEKRKGNHCIGCPDSATCGGKCSGGCGGCGRNSGGCH